MPIILQSPGRSTELGAYLAETARGRFAWGVLDCGTFMADWLVRCGWPDPLADRRGRYAGLKDAIAGDADLEAACARRLAAIGLVETTRPEAGAVALAALPVRSLGGTAVMGLAGAICLDEARAAVLTRSGLTIARLSLKRIWHCPRP